MTGWSDPQGVVRPYPPRGRWVERAACRGADPAVFYPTATGPASKTALAPIRDICASCPVAAECLDYALACEDLDPYGGHGIWAGLTGKERNRLRQQLKDTA